jgi:hypothetical protein
MKLRLIGYIGAMTLHRSDRQREHRETGTENQNREGKPASQSSPGRGRLLKAPKKRTKTMSLDRWYDDFGKV